MVSGDLMFALIHQMGNTAPSGFDGRFTTLYDANNVGTRLSLYAMTVNTVDSGATFTFTLGAVNTVGRLYTWRGAGGVGQITSSVNASSATVTWATMQPAFDGSSIMACFGTGIQTGTDGGITGGGNTYTARGGTPYNIGTTNASEMYSFDGPGSKTTGAATMNNTQAAVNTGLFVEILASSGGGGAVGGSGSGFSSNQARGGGYSDLSRNSPRGLASGLTGV
jgi:hypothetical protein